MSETTVIPRRSLHGELAFSLRDMIMNGELKPGEKIAEQILCTRFGVSRTPLREALKVLAAEGLLDLHQNRGATVAWVTKEEINDLFPIMGALEALAGELACTRITPAQLEGLQKLHKTMVGHYLRKEAAPYLRLNKTIHAAFFEIAGNHALTQYYQTLLIRTRSVRFFAKKSPERWKEAVEDHNRMIEALVKRDGPMLGVVLREHLQHKAAMVLEATTELDGSRPDAGIHPVIPASKQKQSKPAQKSFVAASSYADRVNVSKNGRRTSTT